VVAHRPAVSPDPPSTNPPPAPLTVSPRFREVSRPEAARRLGGPLRSMDGMGLDHIEIGPASAVPGAQSGLDVIRMVYRTPDGGRLLLDQQRIPADTDGLRSIDDPTLENGETAYGTGPGGVSVASWLDEAAIVSPSWRGRPGLAQEAGSPRPVNRPVPPAPAQPRFPRSPRVTELPARSDLRYRTGPQPTPYLCRSSPNPGFTDAHSCCPGVRRVPARPPARPLGSGRHPPGPRRWRDRPDAGLCGCRQDGLGGQCEPDITSLRPPRRWACALTASTDAAMSASSPASTSISAASPISSSSLAPGVHPTASTSSAAGDTCALAPAGQTSGLCWRRARPSTPGRDFRLAARGSPSSPRPDT